MTDKDLLQHIHDHHVISSEHHGRMAKSHAAIARHFETTDPRLSRLHQDLADTHSDHADHHEECGKRCGEDSGKATGGDLIKTYEILSATD